jgi:hypothetical protein
MQKQSRQVLQFNGMSVVVICLFALAVLAAGIVLYFIAKAPKLTPEKNIAEILISTSDELFPYRQEIRSLITDSLNLYTQHDGSVLAHRYSMVERRKQEIGQKLFAADSALALYQSAKAHRRFYEVANATLGALRQATTELAELKEDVTVLEPIVATLRRLGTLAQDNIMTTYVADGDDGAAARVASHIGAISTLTSQAVGQISAARFHTDEFQRIAQSISVVLGKIGEDYTDLHTKLSARQHESYRNLAQALPVLFSRFDTGGYDSILTTTFSNQPEASYVNELRSYLY